MYQDAMKKIRWCLGDIQEFVDLIEINSSDTELTKRYQLLQKISGEKIVNRFENLIIRCWSAKDWISKELKERMGEKESKIFEEALYENEFAQMIQYLADQEKHRDIDPSRLQKNKYVLQKPRLEKTFLHMYNNSFPGELKPFFAIEGNTVPPFSIENVTAEINGEIFYNFDTLILSVRIIDKDNQIIGHAMNSVTEYINLVTKKYDSLVTPRSR